jgi:hypothetical protein
MWPFSKKKNENEGDTFTVVTLGEATEDGSTKAATILSLEEIEALEWNFPGEAVAGHFVEDVVEPGSFRPNEVFVNFMHHVIETTGPEDPDLIEAAQGVESGALYIIDLRTPEGPDGDVAGEDIIGAFAVKSGQITADSYRINESHQTYTEHGLVQLPDSLKEAFVQALAQIA